MVNIKESLKAFRESWIACMLAMVQGDLTVITLKHAMVAAKLGIVSALSVALCTFLKKNPSQWMIAWVIGVMTILGDWLIHPANFQGEALVTGAGAFALSILFSKVKW